MRSSSESSLADSEAMFPSELDPPGSSSHNVLSNGGVAGSTPPQSQDLNNDIMDTQDGGDTGISVRETGWGNAGSSSGMSAFAQSAMSQESNEPGACWNNKKVKEDYQRAIHQIEDKGFNLSEWRADENLMQG